jgi:hypothetical protein
MHIPVQELHSIRDAGELLNISGKNFLSIELSPGGLSYCILDSDKFRYNLLESYAFRHQTDFDQLSMLLEEFVKEKQFLNSSFQRVSISYVSPKAVYVPFELFSYLEKRKYLDFNTYPDDEYDVVVDKLNNLQAYTIYPVHKAVIRKLNYLFPGYRIRHNSSCLIENCLYLVRYGDLRVQLVLHIQKDHFEILVFDNKNLQFCNSFIYQTWDDLFYYLFFVLEQLGLNAEKLDALLLGEVSITGEFYKKIRLYVNSLVFGPRSELYKYSDGFDEIPHHYYFNLLNLNSCG